MDSACIALFMNNNSTRRPWGKSKPMQKKKKFNDIKWKIYWTTLLTVIVFSQIEKKIMSS